MNYGKGVLTGLSAAVVGVRVALADDAVGGDDIASSGNGGVATSSASGGAVGIGDVNSGGNAGNAIGIGDTYGGSVFADGGEMANSTQLSVSANGGTSIADASGGNYNLAFVS